MFHSKVVDSIDIYVFYVMHEFLIRRGVFEKINDILSKCHV